MSEAEEEARKKFGRQTVWTTCILLIFTSIATFISMTITTFAVLNSCYYSDHFDVIGCRQGLSNLQLVKAYRSFNQK